MNKLLKTTLFLGCFLIATVLFAQFDTAEVLGTVRDPSGAAVPKATVTMTNQDTGIKVQTSSDDNGSYDFFNVKVGHYSITVEHIGFSKFTTTDVQVTVNARQRVDVTMQVGAVTESVDVKGVAAALETDTSEHGQVINTTAITELPLNGRNYADLALLSTNAVKSPIAISFSASGTPREAAFNVNGMRSTYNNFLLDGMDNNSFGTSNQGYSSQLVQLSPDALGEFKVITSNYSAEYGRVGGAVISAVMKSGTNDFHGSGWEFLRNTDLNAVGFLFSPAVFVKPTLQRNQFGATIGGPIVKNKLFFFGDYEGLRQLQRYLNFDSIPDASDRLGILPVAVVNPLTGVVYPANTQIPIAKLNPFANTALTGLPPTNNAGCSTVGSSALPTSCRSNNDEALLLIRDYGDKFDAKIDGQINDRMTAFLRFSQRKDLQYYQPDITGPSGGDGNGYIHTIDQDASAGYTWTVTPTSIFEARLGFSHMLAGKEPPYIGGPSMSSLFPGEFAGLPTTPSLTGGLASQYLTGFTTPTMGRQTSNPQFQNPTAWDPQLNFSKTIGRHSLKVGYEYMYIRTEILDTNPLYGEDQYNGSFSKPTCAQLGLATGCTVPSDSTSYSLSDFYFGLPATIYQGSYTVVNLRQFVHSLYFQDDWRVTSKLTMNLGLRWDFASPLYERDNNYSNFDPTTDTMIKASNGGLYQRGLVHPDYGDLGPRLGMAYSFDAKTVVRAGYGVSYTFFNRPGSAQEGINAPQALFGVLSQSNPLASTFLTTGNSFTDNIASPTAFNPANSNVVYTPPDSKWPRIQNWFIDVQRKLPKDTVLELSYNGNHSTRLPIIADYNEAVPNAPGASLPYTSRVPIPSFGPITWLDPAGDNHYNGLSARIEHQFTKNLYVLNSFTWGKGMGDSEQALEYYAGYFQANPQNINNLHAEKGLSSFDVKLNNVTSVVYALPFGKGRQYLANMHPVLDAILGGWELNAINTAHTGTPLDVIYATSGSAAEVSSLGNDYRGEPFPRPNVTGNAISQSRSAMLNTYFAGYTFSTPSASAPFGDVGRNAFRAPNFEQWDQAIDKFFNIHENIRLQFRAEFFNVLNHTNFGIPNTITTNAAFGTIRTTYPSRVGQFALKLLF